MSEWKTYKLGDVAQIIGGGTPSTTKEEYWNGEIGWLTPRDLTGYSFKYISKGERNITEEGLKNSSARLMPEGTVLMTSRAPIGYLAIAGDELCTNQGFKSFIVDEDKINNEYLYYLLKSNIDRIKSLGTGSTFAEVSATILKGFEIEIPDLPTQRQIAQILTSLDDKIELNLQMNQTLEAMAQAIFKEWFVDFNFPGFDGELVDGLPKGWRKGNLGEMISFKNGKTSPERNNDFQYPVYGSNGIIGYSENFNAVENISIVGRVGSFCGSTYLSTKKCWVTDNAIIAQSINDYSIFTYLTLLNLNLNNFRAGSGQPLLNQTILSAIPLNIPSPELLEEFENQTMPFFKKIELNLDTNKQLEDIRNTALPKLMSGNIEVMNT